MLGVMYVVIIVVLCGLPFALLATDLARGGAHRGVTADVAVEPAPAPVADGGSRAATPGVVTCHSCGRSARVTLWRVSRARPAPTHLCCPHCGSETPSTLLS